MAVLRRPATSPGLLRIGPAAAVVDGIVDEARRAAPGSALEVTFHTVPDALVAQLVPRLLQLAGGGLDVRVARASRGVGPLRWRATAQPVDDDVSAWPPPAA